MRNLGVFGLSLAVLLQVLSASFIVLDYRINQSYIIANFCVNTDKPEMKCNGKCHLIKQIKEDSEQKSEAPAAESELISFVLTVQEITTFEFSESENTKADLNSPYLEGNYSKVLQSVFHPPQV